MRLKKNIAKKGRELQGAKGAPGSSLKLQSAEITQQQLKEAYEAAQRAAHVQCSLRDILNRGAEVERGRYWLHGHIIQCPRCKCSYTEDGQKFHPVDSKLYKPDASEDRVVPFEDCPRCAARDLVEEEIARAAK